MPFNVFEKKNPVISTDAKLTNTVLSVNGYFSALAKIINEAYSEYSESKIIDEVGKEQKTHQKQSTYFALYSLLEFIS